MPAPDVDGPEQSPDAGPSPLVFPGAELRIVSGVDTWSVDAPAGPAELFVWVRYRAAPDDVATNQAILAWGTDGFLIGTAMPAAYRHRAGGRARQALDRRRRAHAHLPRAVHAARLAADQAHESPHAGGGRSYGRAQVFTRDGRLVASFVQDNMIRAAAPSGGGPRREM